MQLAWSKTVDLYIGQGLVMLKLNSEITHISEHATTMPLDRMLSSCSDWVKSGTKLRVYLSSSYCSGFKAQIPTSVMRISEKKVLLSASAAQQLNAPGIEFECAIDPNNKSLAAAIPISVRNTIQAWVQQLRCTIVSLRPLWAVVTQFSACKNTNIKCIAVHEPDGSILIAETQNDELQIISLRGYLSSDAMKAHLRRSLVSFGMKEENVLSLQFVARPANPLKNAPDVWHGHWTAS